MDIRGFTHPKNKEKWLTFGAAPGGGETKASLVAVTGCAYKSRTWWQISSRSVVSRSSTCWSHQCICLGCLDIRTIFYISGSVFCKKIWEMAQPGTGLSIDIFFMNIQGIFETFVKLQEAISQNFEKNIAYFTEMKSNFSIWIFFMKCSKGKST